MGIELVDRDVLLVIDVQNDFCDGGALRGTGRPGSSAGNQSDGRAPSDM